MEKTHNKTKRTLILTTSFPRNKEDASSLFVYNLADYLSSYGKVNVLCPSSDKSESQFINKVKVIRFNYFIPRLQKLAFGIPDKYKRYWFQIPFLLFFFYKNSIKIINNYDSINAQWLMPTGLIGALLKKRYNKKFVLTVHNTDVNLMRRLPFSKYLTNFIVKNADKVFVISNNSREKLLSMCNKKYTGKISVMPMGVNVKYRKVNKKLLQKKYGIKSDKVIMFIGRLVKLKGLDYLIKALKGIDNITLIVAGDGSERDKLVKLAKDLNVKAIFLGQVVGSKKEDYLLCSDLLVVPSIKLRDGRNDGVPTVALEALSLGIPVVGSDATSLNEIIRNGYNGFIIKEKDSQELKSIINSCYNTGKLKKMAKNAYLSSKKFDIKKIGLAYFKALKN